jgi:hypothetical protein
MFEKYHVKANALMFGGLIAISLIILQDFIPASNLDVSAWISVLALAAAIPCLAFTILLENIRKDFDLKFYSQIHWVFAGYLYLFGVIVDLIGIGAAIWHIMWIAGVLFAINGVIGFIVYMRAEQKTLKEAKEKAEADNQPVISQPDKEK